MLVTLTLNPSLDEWVQVPRLRVGELNRARSFQRYPGGKGINVSRVVHELGEPTMAVAVAGGSDGQTLSHLLTQQGIAHHFVHVEGLTRNNYQIQTLTPAAMTQINCPGPRIPPNALREIARLLERLEYRASGVVCSGSLPPGVPSSIYARLLRALRRRCVLTALDSSGRALHDGLQAKPWFIKPNRQEAEELLGMRLRTVAHVVAAAKRLAQARASVVVISLGSDGAVLAAQQGAVACFAKPPKVRVNSTVGAGDSLVAGFLVGWLKTRSLHEAFRLGIACGAATVMTSGTELCHRRDVEALRRRVTVRDL